MLDPLSISIPLPTATARPTYPKRKLLTPSSEHADDYIMELSYSGLSSFMECPKKFENHYIKSRELDRDTIAMDFGDLFHKLEQKRLVAGGLSDEVQKQQTEKIVEHFIEKPSPPNDYRTSDRMLQVIRQYNNIYKTDGWEKKVYHDINGPFVERPFKIELTTIEVNTDLPYPPLLITNDGTNLKEFMPSLPVRNIHVFYRGLIDLVLQEGEQLWVPDHKTSSRGGREFVEAFRLSNQTRSYCWAVQKITGLPTMGTIINGVIVRPLTKTGVGTEFNRGNYYYTQDSIDECELNMKAVVTDIIANLVRGFFPQHARSFISPCAKCEYQENCALPRNQRDADLASDLYRDVKVSKMTNE